MKAGSPPILVERNSPAHRPTRAELQNRNGLIVRMCLDFVSRQQPGSGAAMLPDPNAKVWRRFDLLAKHE